MVGRSFFWRKKADLASANLNRKGKEKSDEDPKRQANKTVRAPAPRGSRKSKTKKHEPSAAAASRPRSVSKEFKSPLTTIQENHDERPKTAKTQPVSPVLRSVNLMNTSRDASIEAVAGSASPQGAAVGPEKEPAVVLDGIHVFENRAMNKNEFVEVIDAEGEMQTHDDIRKKLFNDEEDNSHMWTDESNPIEEPPFDEKAEYHGDEDPSIMDLIKLDKEQNRSEGGNSSLTGSNSIADHEKAFLLDGSNPPKNFCGSDVPRAVLTKKIMRAFNCNTDTTQDTLKKLPCRGMDAFYDTMCAPMTGNGKRPFYSKEFSRDFLEDAIQDGIPLMYYYEPEENGDSEAPVAWKGHSVTMYVRQGSYQGLRIEHPRIEWPTPQQSWMAEELDAVNLMDIQSIFDSAQDELRDDIYSDVPETMDFCFFSITTTDGDVYMFETGSPAERDWIVTGLRNVIVRLSYQLTSGDPALSSELFSAEYDHGTGDLPTLKTPTKAMNEVAHAFLD